MNERLMLTAEMDWQQKRALEMLSEATDSSLGGDGGGMVFRGSEAVILDAQQIGALMKAGLIQFCGDRKNAFEITDTGRNAMTDDVGQ